MTLEVFLFILLIVSAFTGLFTEGVKMLLQELDIPYHANALAGVVAIVLSLLVGSSYIILMAATINAQMVVYLIALVLLSWLCAMVGYDKVIQTITQFKN
jgi:hypothetical protein